MKTKSKKLVKTTKTLKEYYSFKNYSPNKNAVPVTYKGTKYLSKAQCIALEGITRKELDAYLNGEETIVRKAEQTTEDEELNVSSGALPNNLNDLLNA